MEVLSQRQEKILHAVIVEYVDTGEPVPSALIVRRYPLGVGPATVRKELSELAERGYVEQPHTSAGRIPSDRGYRYYVERLAHPQTVPKARAHIRHLAETESDMEELFSATCRFLADLTHALSLAATINQRKTSVKHVTLSALGSGRLLLTVVLSTGVVENRIVEASDFTLDHLASVTAFLKQQAENQKLRQLSRRPIPVLPHAPPQAQALFAKVWKALRSLARSLTAGKIISEGTPYLISQPEFQKDVHALTEILTLLGDNEIARGAIEQPAERTPAVCIGRENEPEPLKRLAIIAGKVTVKGEEAGVIAIVGPMRLKYEFAIPLVQETSRALSDVLSQLSA